jgi:hypothetical protein
MNDQPETFALVPLTQAILNTWDNPSIIRLCDLASAGVPAYELSILPKQDLILKHSIPH